jgi:hypothetical protein
VGKYIAQRLVAEGETVFDVSTRRAALVRVFFGDNGRKTDDIDAETIALVGLRTPELPQVRGDELTVKLGLLSNRRSALVGLRTQIVFRIHRDLQNPLPGGSSKRLTAKEAQGDPVEGSTPRRDRQAAPIPPRRPDPRPRVRRCAHRFDQHRLYRT